MMPFGAMRFLEANYELHGPRGHALDPSLALRMTSPECGLRRVLSRNRRDAEPGGRHRGVARLDCARAGFARAQSHCSLGLANL